MDTCQDNFLVSGFRNPAHLVLDVLRAAAVTRPSVWYGIISNSCKTGCSRPVPWINVAYGQQTGRYGVLRIPVNVRYPESHRRFYLGKIIIQICTRSFFWLLPTIDDRLIFFFQLRACCLHITANRHNCRRRVHFLCPVQHLARFPVGNIRHGTRVDNINIRSFPERQQSHILNPLRAMHGFRLIRVHLMSRLWNAAFLIFISLLN